MASKKLPASEDPFRNLMHKVATGVKDDHEAIELLKLFDRKIRLVDYKTANVSPPKAVLSSDRILALISEDMVHASSSDVALLRGMSSPNNYGLLSAFASRYTNEYVESFSLAFPVAAELEAVFSACDADRAVRILKGVKSDNAFGTAVDALLNGYGNRGEIRKVLLSVLDNSRYPTVRKVLQGKRRQHLNDSSDELPLAIKLQQHGLVTIEGDHNAIRLAGEL